MEIKCIKGFTLGGLLAIMRGEIFKLVDTKDMIFEGEANKSRYPGEKINFTEQQLAENFKLINKKVVSN